jgi:hypothetical protein
VPYLPASVYLLQTLNAVKDLAYISKNLIHAWKITRRVRGFVSLIEQSMQHLHHSLVVETQFLASLDYLKLGILA